MSANTMEDLRDYLIANTTLVAGTSLFGGMMPTSPDAATVLYDSGGGPPMDTGGGSSKPAVENPRIQVQARAANYHDARAAIRTVYNALVLVVDTVINSTLYQRIQAVQEPFLLHNDEANRTVFACNFDVYRDPE